jgi:shikimate dehydrogenase
MNDLNALRSKIDEIDDKIMKLLEARFAAAKEIGEYKNSRGLDVFDQDRENEILDKISDKYILKIYSEILEMSKAAQSPDNINKN